MVKKYIPYMGSEGRAITPIATHGEAVYWYRYWVHGLFIGMKPKRKEGRNSLLVVHIGFFHPTTPAVRVDDG